MIKIRRANIDTRLITTASLNSMVCWGADCLGAPPQQIKDRRRLIHCSVSANTMGRSATIDFALAKGKVRNLDPSYSLTTAPIYALALAVWDRWCPQEWIMRVWSSAFRVASKPKFHWNVVNDPVTAAAASFVRIGWSSHAPGVLRTHLGAVINLNKTCPKSTKLMAEDAVEDWLLSRFVASDDRMRPLGPAAIPWLDPLRDSVSKRTSATWTRTHQAFVRAAGADGIWLAERLAEADMIVGGECRVCGDRGTIIHRCFGCSGTQTYREQYGLPAGLAQNALADQENPLWTCGIVIDPTRCLPPPSLELPRWTIRPQGGKFTTGAFGDGSGEELFGP